jgi:hypothetical protein
MVALSGKVDGDGDGDGDDSTNRSIDTETTIATSARTTITAIKYFLFIVTKRTSTSNLL